MGPNSDVSLFLLDIVRKPFVHFGFLDLHLGHGPRLQEGGGRRPEVAVHPHVAGGMAPSSQEALGSTGHGLLLRVPSGTRPPQAEGPHAGAEPPLRSLSCRREDLRECWVCPGPGAIRAARCHLGQETLAAQEVPPGATLSLAALGAVFLCSLLGFFLPLFVL